MASGRIVGIIPCVTKIPASSDRFLCSALCVLMADKHCDTRINPLSCVVRCSGDGSATSGGSGTAPASNDAKTDGDNTSYPPSSLNNAVILFVVTNLLR